MYPKHVKHKKLLQAVFYQFQQHSFVPQAIFSPISEEDQQCDTGYFPQIIGYRRHYGDCYGNDLNLGSNIQTLSECMKMCNEDERCKAFSYINPPLFRLHKSNWGDQNCLPKSSCSENTLNKNLSGIYTYFKGLTETGK